MAVLISVWLALVFVDVVWACVTVDETMDAEGLAFARAARAKG